MTLCSVFDKHKYLLNRFDNIHLIIIIIIIIIMHIIIIMQCVKKKFTFNGFFYFEILAIYYRNRTIQLCIMIKSNTVLADIRVT